MLNNEAYAPPLHSLPRSPSSVCYTPTNASKPLRATTTSSSSSVTMKNINSNNSNDDFEASAASFAPATLFVIYARNRIGLLGAYFSTVYVDVATLTIFSSSIKRREEEAEGITLIMGWPIIFLFPPPDSLFITAMAVISFTGCAHAGLSEVRGIHLQYSKFWKSGSQKSNQIYISARRGMQLAYTPPFLAGLTSLVFFPHCDDIRYLLLSSALIIHFLKRLLEVQFVHKYSGGVALDSGITITVSYLMSTVAAIYAQHLTITQGLREPPIDLKYPGILLFLLGISGNFYHHYLLSQLRSSSSLFRSHSQTNDDKEYKIPRGGLFELVICPHYLFEIIEFVGFSFISQTLYTFAFVVGTTFYLIGRSYATRKWYLSRFKHFPQKVKALIPYLY
ncbi:uncharacterized protein LOC126783834 [Argentina anserina]|uniref:uncharacterized protein LOC126783834 n=1 Tax=Argentina anserina TaxID=57926 RepID=UPI0021765B1F|nr:uncharacterized protein LOC126783834 [Potentilla anserina]